MGLPQTLQQIVDGDQDTPTRDMTNWNTLRDILNGNVDNDNISSSAAIAYSKLTLTASVDDEDMKNGIASDRQGGSATDWGNSGTTQYSLATKKVRMLCGSATSDGGSPNTVTVTFPVAFAQIPIVQTTVQTSITTGDVSCSLETTSATNFVVNVAGAQAARRVLWYAIGEIA